MTELVWLVLRAAGFALLLQAAGAALFLAAFGTRLTDAAAAVRHTGRNTAIAALVVLAAQYLIEPVYMAGEWAGMTDAALHHLVLASATGATLALRAAAMVAVVGGLASHGRAARAAAAAAGVVAVVGSFILTGHTAVHPHRVLLAALLLIHLLCVVFWFGALGPLRQVCALEPRERAAHVLRMFSAAALWLVPLLALAGAGMAVLLLPDLAALLAPYGLLLLAKVALFAALMALAALNRLRLVPALARGDPRATKRLRQSVAAEYLLIWVVLAVTAALTGLFSPAPADAGAA
jgi:putative copper resistance protein D